MSGSKLKKLLIEWVTKCQQIIHLLPAAVAIYSASQLSCPKNKKGQKELVRKEDTTRSPCSSGGCVYHITESLGTGIGSRGVLGAPLNGVLINDTPRQWQTQL